MALFIVYFGFPVRFNREAACVNYHIFRLKYLLL